MEDIVYSRFVHYNLLEDQEVSDRATKRLKKVLRSSLITFVLVTILLFYAGSRIQIISMGYDMSRQSRYQEELLLVNERLQTRISYLRSPSYIEEAAKDLGLAMPERERIITIP